MSDPGTEVAKEAAKAAAVTLAGPIADIISDTLGGLFGDPIHNWRRNKPAWRERNERDTANRAARILADRGVSKIADDANPAEVERIIDASKDVSDQTLKDLFAKLIAAAIDPERSQFYRREFLRVAGELDPIDALVLPLIDVAAQIDPNKKQWIAQRISRQPSEVELALRNLLRLELTWEPPGGAGNPKIHPILTTLGKQFLQATQ